MGVGVAGADPKAVGLGRRQLVGRDQELERLFGMIDQIKAEACSHHQANGEGDRQRAKGGPR